MERVPDPRPRFGQREVHDEPPRLEHAAASNAQPRPSTTTDAATSRAAEPEFQMWGRCGLVPRERVQPGRA